MTEDGSAFLSEPEIPQQHFHGPVTEQDYIEAQSMDPADVAMLKLRLERAEEELAKRGIDPLTGLLKGDAFMLQLKNRLSRLGPNSQRARPDSAMIVHIDVKGLKLANDTNGHHAGDQILRNSADLVRALIRADEGDLAGRLHDHGDELAVAIFFNSDQISHEAMQESFNERMMNRLREAVAAGQVSGLKWNSALYVHGKTPDQLLHESDPVAELHPGKVLEFPSKEDLPSRDQRETAVS